ncbi:MAG: hypothetical protein U0Q16_38435 [Bryobacteraceae bacterium]
MAHTFFRIVTLAAAFAAAASAQEISATLASQSGDFARPLDATPDPDGSAIYFTAIGPNGPGVFRVAAVGGPVTAIATGAPFVDPAGISISNDGRFLYVADSHAWAGRGRLGQIFVLPVSGGAVQTLHGAEGRAPRGLEVTSDDNVFFTGIDPATRRRGVYRVPVAGADAASVVFEGAPLVAPDGIAVSRNGTVYFTERGGASASVCKIERGAVSTVVEFIRAGDPAGIALSLDESALLVSTLQPYRNRAQVLLVDLATLEPRASTNGIGQNPSAGGLHRARNAAVFAWADTLGGGTGGVYRVVR